VLLAGCATRPINPPITKVDPQSGYRFENIHAKALDQENLVVLAFSGGGTRAAAFSYGVLEFLRRTELATRSGKKIRLIDEVDIITGVSGGSFTALAYGLYGDKLFSQYEQQFLKRNVQGEIISRVFDPVYWPSLWSAGWGRSELAAQLYDEILFKGATYKDLIKAGGPFIAVSATDISSGARFVFNQRVFDVICSDLDAMPLSRAAAASSAVPVVLSPVTLNNYGGHCGWQPPEWMKAFIANGTIARPGARTAQTAVQETALGDSAKKPYIHLVDGGVSDNVGMRSVLEGMEMLEALYDTGVPTPLDRVKRIIIFVVNSISEPKTNWDQSERPPDSLTVLLKAAGTPIDRNSYETVELLKDTTARWQTSRLLQNSAAMKANKDPEVAKLLKVPDAEIYTIDVSFKEVKDEAERDYLNEQPTSFHLPSKAVDRLRSAAGNIIMESPDFKKLVQDVGATIVPVPAGQ